MKDIIQELKIKSKGLNFSKPKPADSLILIHANRLTVIKDETQNMAIKLGELADSIALSKGSESTDEFKIIMQPVILDILKKKTHSYLGT
ncbi:MAG: hypothetical protein ACI82Q_002399 [Nonlabens sp.]|jgi:hypothetical protein